MTVALVKWQSHLNGDAITVLQVGSADGAAMVFRDDSDHIQTDTEMESIV